MQAQDLGSHFGKIVRIEPDGEVERPVYYWDPVVSPSGLTIYTGTLLPEWRFFLGGLSSTALIRLMVRDDK